MPLVIPEAVLSAVTLLTACARMVVVSVSIVGAVLAPPSSEQAGPVNRRSDSPVKPYRRSEDLDRSDVELATVQIAGPHGSGSGVCVDRRGFVLTARHVITSPFAPVPRSLRVTFPGLDPLRGQIVWMATGGDDGAVLIRCVADGDLPWMPVAQATPVSGSPISSCGYHAGNIVRFRGRLLGHSPRPLQIDNTGRRYLLFSYGALAGMSGGPIVNDEGSVISLAVWSNLEQSVGLSLPAVRLACQRIPAAAPVAARPQPKRGEETTPPVRKTLVEYWWSDGCLNCKRFSEASRPGTELRRQLDARYEVRSYCIDDWPEQAASRSIDSAPSFYIPSIDRLVAGYVHPEQLLSALSAPRAHAAPAPQYPQQASPPPALLGGGLAEERPVTDQPPLAPHESETVASDEEPPPEDVSPAVGGGPLGRLRQWIVELIRTAVACVVSMFVAWRASQGFLKRRIIDRVVNQAVEKVSQRIDDSPVLSRARSVASRQLHRSPTPQETFDERSQH